MDSQLISIIIPIYNREKYLEKCIQSAINQDGVSTEIILVDDGSTDNSLVICNSYTDCYSNIKVIHQDNHGLGIARNVGLNNASGDYICFLDSDDILVPHTLATMLHELLANDADYIIGDAKRISEDGTIISDSIMPDSVKNRILDETNFWECAQNQASYLVFVTVWGKLFKKELWESMRFSDVKLGEDEFILPMLLSQSKRIYFTALHAYTQTISSNSLVRSSYSVNTLYSPESKLFVANYLFNKGFYQYAINKFQRAKGEIVYYGNILQDKDSKKKVKYLIKQSRVFTKKIFHHLTLRQKIVYLLFSYMPRVYLFLTKIDYNLKHKH